MAASELEELIRDTERRRLRSLVERDMEAARALHANEYQLITPGGEKLTKSDYLDDVESGAIEYQVFEPDSQMEVRMYSEAALVRYQVRIDIRVGEDRYVDRFWHTDLYEFRDDRWQCVWSQATRINRGA